MNEWNWTMTACKDKVNRWKWNKKKIQNKLLKLGESSDRYVFYCVGEDMTWKSLCYECHLPNVSWIDEWNTFCIRANLFQL